MEFLDQASKLLQILFVDLVLAGDNAIVIGLVAARFSPEYRRKVIFYGVGVAVILRIVFALVTVQLLQIKGIALIGGLLLLYVCWKLWQELRSHGEMLAEADSPAPGVTENPPMFAAIFQIILADVSMSLDNVLAVAGIADGHTVLLVVGLTISIVFMMFFANWIADILQKHRWIGYVGLAVILYVAIKLVYEGAVEVIPLMSDAKTVSMG